MPRHYETRVQMIVVGKAIGKPREVWAVQEFRSCDCPNCDLYGHWYGWGMGGYETKEEAEQAAEERSFYKPGELAT